jgi:guanine deaminase
MTFKTFRGSILHFPQQTQAPEQDYHYYDDGLLVTRNGKIIDLGNTTDLLGKYTGSEHHDYRGHLILPGLIDSHLHFPQTEMLASYGEQLLEWLQNYTFPTELKFTDLDYSQRIAEVFVRQLLRNGTTTAMVYSTVHKAATNALFEVANNKNMLMVAGKVCMDRNCPEPLRDTPYSAQRDSAELIEKWHGNGRQNYAITPRFAPTSSPEQMLALSELAAQYPDVFIQTHLSENKNEIAWVKSLYPGFDHYLDVYDHYNMVRHRAFFGHCLYLHEHEWCLLQHKGASVSFCPTSNLFLGSGLFDLKAAQEHQVNLTLATDVGAGTSFNMLRTMGEAYKVCQLQGARLCPLHGLYLMTQGSAVAMGLEQKIGNLNQGSDADFVVLNPNFDELTELRLNADKINPQDSIFALSMLGDDRAVTATWVAGNLVYINKEDLK